MSIQFGDDRLRAELDTDATPPTVLLRAGPNGRTWGRVPVAAFAIHNDMDQRTTAQTRLKAKAVTPIEGGLHVLLEHRQSGITATLMLMIREGRLTVRMPMSEWFEEDDAVFRLYGVRFLPGLMQVGASGSVLLPLGAGARFCPADKPAVADEFLVYGEQSRWELLPMLPTAGVSEGEDALVVLLTGCPEDASLLAWTDGNGAGGVDAGACLRQHWIDPVDRSDREAVYEALPPATDLLHGTADLLRRHATEDLGCTPIEKRLQDSGPLAKFLEGPMIALKLGVSNRGIGRANPRDPDYGEYFLGSTCAEAEEHLRACKDIGIEKLYALVIGFLPHGHDGCYPSHVRFDPRIGGEAGFRRLVNTARELGFTIHVHDNFNEGYEISPEFEWRWCSRDLYGRPQHRGRWGGGQAYLQWMLDLPAGRVEKAMEAFREMGLNGMGYIDAVGNPLYRNYDPEHGGPRRDHARGIERVLASARSIYGAVFTECGFLYAARHCDAVRMPGHHHRNRKLRPEWPIAALIDERVPLYRLALSGLLVGLYGTKGNLRDALLATHAGLHLSFEGGSTRSNYGRGVITPEVIANLKAYCDTLQPLNRRLAVQRLVRWEKRGSQCEYTAFEDGTETEIDLDAGQLTVNGEQAVSGHGWRDAQPS